LGKKGSQLRFLIFEFRGKGSESEPGKEGGGQENGKAFPKGETVFRLPGIGSITEEAKLHG
jgi:hypothetical protein